MQQLQNQGGEYGEESEEDYDEEGESPGQGLHLNQLSGADKSQDNSGSLYNQQVIDAQ